MATLCRAARAAGPSETRSLLFFRPAQRLELHGRLLSRANGVDRLVIEFLLGPNATALAGDLFVRAIGQQAPGLDVIGEERLQYVDQPH